MNLKIAVLPGDGIGPEVTGESIKVLNTIAKKYHHNFDYIYGSMGACAIEESGTPLPDETLKICHDSDAILFGAIGDPKYDNDPTASIRPEQGLLKLRKSLGLYANIRPVLTFETLLDQSPLKNDIIRGVDFVILRELTGGIYFGKKEKNIDGSSASDLCIYSKYEIERITHQAFQLAIKRNKKLTLVDKANVLESSRLWRAVVKKIHKDHYQNILLDFLFVDNAAMQIIQNPKQFDVILTGNMFGDILSDEASVISGSIGLLPSASTGDKHALFEPIHGSYPQAKGKNIANPIASILSSSMLLSHFGLSKESEVIKASVMKSLDRKICTPDIDKTSQYTTREVGDFIVAQIL